MVQVSFINGDIAGSNFDESRNRVTPRVQYEDWSEYLVVWRKSRVELYKNYVRVSAHIVPLLALKIRFQSIPGAEWLMGHKALTFLIPLEQTTKLSLYSFTDLSFVLTCPSSSHRTRSRTRTRLLLYGSREGTNIFIFNVRSRTRAVDWMWKLWCGQCVSSPVPSILLTSRLSLGDI